MSGLMSRNMAPSLSRMSTSTRACHWLTSFELERIRFPVKSKVETDSDNTIHSRGCTALDIHAQGQSMVLKSSMCC